MIRKRRSVTRNAAVGAGCWAGPSLHPPPHHHHPGVGCDYTGSQTSSGVKTCNMSDALAAWLAAGNYGMLRLTSLATAQAVSQPDARRVNDSPPARPELPRLRSALLLLTLKRPSPRLICWNRQPTCTRASADSDSPRARVGALKGSERSVSPQVDSSMPGGPRRRSFSLRLF